MVAVPNSSAMDGVALLKANASIIWILTAAGTGALLTSQLGTKSAKTLGFTVAHANGTTNIMLRPMLVKRRLTLATKFVYQRSAFKLRTKIAPNAKQTTSR